MSSLPAPNPIPRTEERREVDHFRLKEQKIKYYDMTTGINYKSAPKEDLFMIKYTDGSYKLVFYLSASDTYVYWTDDQNIDLIAKIDDLITRIEDLEDVRDDHETRIAALEGP